MPSSAVFNHYRAHGVRGVPDDRDSQYMAKYPCVSEPPYRIATHDIEYFLSAIVPVRALSLPQGPGMLSGRRGREGVAQGKLDRVNEKISSVGTRLN